MEGAGCHGLIPPTCQGGLDRPGGGPSQKVKAPKEKISHFGVTFLGGTLQKVPFLGALRRRGFLLVIFDKFLRPNVPKWHFGLIGGGVKFFGPAYHTGPEILNFD